MRCVTCGSALRLEWEDYWEYEIPIDEFFGPEDMGRLDDDDYHRYDYGEHLASGGYILHCTNDRTHETGYSIDKSNCVVRKDE